ncbi:thioredoxin-like isoform X2 [Ictalurus punctatus]|uniref:Thioredoxin-like isoform X2 n=1 Tax=Ictalurus punctatus TaxID=7998 RepID=A0A2D0QPW3_ICTPU|nr:thioredoxin-like isoform X2 [Ictalurus punctatus]
MGDFGGSVLDCTVLHHPQNWEYLLEERGLSDAAGNANVVFLKVDVDDAQDVAQSCEIKCMPTFYFYKHGKKIDEFSGSNQMKLEELVNTHK